MFTLSVGCYTMFKSWELIWERLSIAFAFLTVATVMLWYPSWHRKEPQGVCYISELGWGMNVYSILT